jgi:hypothetical protein
VHGKRLPPTLAAQNPAKPGQVLGHSALGAGVHDEVHIHYEQQICGQSKKSTQ